MISPINERIKVAAVFDDGFPKPVWFIHHHEKTMIKHICYQWRERNGNTQIYKYTVSDNTAVYELKFDPNLMYWSLIAVDNGNY